MVKREKYRAGMFTREQIRGDARTPEGLEALKEVLITASPQGRIAQLENMAAQVGIEPPEELTEAQGLLEAKGNYDQLNSLLLKAEKKIQAQAQYDFEFELLPIVKRGQKTQQDCINGGRGSWGLEPDKRNERNEIIQKNVDRLCLESGLSYNAACRITANNIKDLYKKNTVLKCAKPISFDRIKQITTDPRKKKQAK